MHKIKKSALLRSIIAHIERELGLSLAAARTAAEGATNEQNKAENKYDTRGLELSYLATGQSRQIAEAQATLSQLQGLVLRDFQPHDPIDFGTLITLDHPTEPQTPPAFYFLAPRGGGTEVRTAKHQVLVITPQSPLGKQLIGRHVGATVQLGPNTTAQRIAHIC